MVKGGRRGPVTSLGYSGVSANTTARRKDAPRGIRRSKNVPGGISRSKIEPGFIRQNGGQIQNGGHLARGLAETVRASGES